VRCQDALLSIVPSLLPSYHVLLFLISIKIAKTLKFDDITFN